MYSYPGLTKNASVVFGDIRALGWLQICLLQWSLKPFDFVGLLICNVFTPKLQRDTEALSIYYVVAHSVLNVRIKLCMASNKFRGPFSTISLY